MSITVIENIKGSEIPVSWLEKAQKKSDGIFKITIEPQKKILESQTKLDKQYIEQENFNNFSLSMAMRDMEEEDEPHYTLSDIKEAW